MAGRRTAKSALKAVVETHSRRPMTADEAMTKYRELIYGEGEASVPTQNGGPVRKGMSRQRVKEVIETKGKLSRMEMLRCRVRYFTDGVALGTKEFVNTVFAAERHRFGAKRKSGARKLRHVEAGELRTLRDLRITPVH